MNNLNFLLGALALCTASAANASMMTLESRDLQAQYLNNSDYSLSWSNHTSAITNISLTKFDEIKSGYNSFNHLKIRLDLGSTDSIGLQFGMDAGYGAAVYLDSDLIASDATDLWWENNWQHSDVISTNISSLSSGELGIDLFWAEGCCNGYNSVRFTANNGNTWESLSIGNIESAYASVPEPSIIAILGAGLIGLGIARRRKSKS